MGWKSFLKWTIHMLKETSSWHKKLNVFFKWWWCSFPSLFSPKRIPAEFYDLTSEYKKDKLLFSLSQFTTSSALLLILSHLLFHFLSWQKLKHARNKLRHCTGRQEQIGCTSILYGDIRQLANIYILSVISPYLVYLNVSTCSVSSLYSY